MRLPIAEIEEKIGYEFKDKNLLKQAFVHSSYGRMKGIDDNERMEYLGDAVLQLVVTEWQYLRDGSDEGKMTSDRQKLVCEETLLAEVEELGLEKYLLYAGKLSQNVGKKAVSSLFETLVAAIYLDGGYDVVKKFILERMSDRDTTNYKGVLQEFLQGKGESLPVYETVKYGSDNAPLYKATAKALGLVGKGEGRSKKSAEQLAAKDLIEQLS
ncbi:MAG: ribonuclease III [Clostridia bacterium]|nr:ribonuclease III [Clostridia bacterium]